MTSRELLLLMLRRWYVVLLVGALGAGLLAAVWVRPGVYYARYEVVVLAPRNDVNPNEMENSSFSLTPLAGLLAQDVMGQRRTLLMGSSDTTIFGEGVRSGYRVRLPNTGSQFVPQYDRPVLDVEVVDPDRDVVVDRIARLQRALERALASRQDEYRLPSGQRISLIASPDDPVIQYVAGRRSRAAAGVLLLTVVAATLVVLWSEFARRWWRSRRRTGSRTDAAPAGPGSS